MDSSKNIKEIIFSAIDEFNLSQQSENRLEKREDEVLFSRAGYTEAGKLDSLTLVYFLVTLEEQFQKEFGAGFDLKTQDLIESKEQKLKNIASLISYIQNRI